MRSERNEDRPYYSILLEFYGGLLSDRQREMLSYSIDDDLSLSEIAELTGITRQGVRDAIGKAESQLVFYEEKLGMYSTFVRRRECGETLSDMIESGSDDKSLMLELVRQICGDLNS